MSADTEPILCVCGHAERDHQSRYRSLRRVMFCLVAGCPCNDFHLVVNPVPVKEQEQETKIYGWF